MRTTRIPVAVEFERVAVASRWADSRWQPSRVALVGGDPNEADESAVERVDAGGALERWRFPGQLTEMHPTEGEGYCLNLNSPDPRAFVMWRMREGVEPPVVPVIVTLSYNQAARMMDGGEQVDSVPLDRADPRAARALCRGALQARSRSASTSATTRSRKRRTCASADPESDDGPTG